MLLLLEGLAVQVGALKRTTVSYWILPRSPVFSNSKTPISFVNSFVLEDPETDMMHVRRRFFHFQHQFSLQEQKAVNLCGNCLANFLLTHT